MKFLIWTVSFCFCCLLIFLATDVLRKGKLNESSEDRVDSDVALASGAKSTKSAELSRSNYSNRAKDSERNVELLQSKEDIIESLVASGALIAAFLPSEDFQFNDNFFKTLDIGDEKKAEIKQLSSQTFEQIKVYEVKSGEVLEESENLIKYKIKGDPEFLTQLKDDFLQELNLIGGSSAAKVASSGVEGFFKSLSNDREISLEVTDKIVGTTLEELEGDPSFQHLAGANHSWARTTVERFSEDGTSMGAQVRQTLVQEGRTQIVPTRYSHLFELTEESTSATDD